MPDPQPPATDQPALTGGAARPATIEEVLRLGAASGRLTHVEHLPARPGRTAAWPDWVPPDLVAAFYHAGVRQPWEHQVIAADYARAGRNVIMATGTASGKSVGYLAPALTSIGEGGTVLYLAPSRALAADQLRGVLALASRPESRADGRTRLPRGDVRTGPRTRDLLGPHDIVSPSELARARLLAGTARGLGSTLRAAVLDSDTGKADRDWARKHATFLLTTPDMLHHGLLPQHQRWAGFWRRLRYVIVDECHGYRGVFGSHVSQVLRRLRRVASHYRASGAPDLVFILASATIWQPELAAELLTGLPARAVTADCSPRPPLTFAMWEPPLTTLRGEGGARRRRTAVAETADLLAEFVRGSVPTLAFIRSRRGAEAAAAATKARLIEAGDGHLAHRVAAYRSGYLADERRRLEESLRTGEITALAATPALELGVNITGLDAVIVAGWPGTRAALWQQAGRAGRDGREALAILVAQDNPLDTYLVHHPAALLHQPVEATVLDPANPYILAPHLRAAAAELPLTDADLALFGPSATTVIGDLTRQGALRERGGRWHPGWTELSQAGGPGGRSPVQTQQAGGPGGRPPGQTQQAGGPGGRPRGQTQLAGLRGTGGQLIRIVEPATGRLVGTIDESSAHVLAHAGAVYQHQGDLYLITSLDLAEGVALAEPGDPGYVTSARQHADISVSAEHRRADWGEASVCFGEVVVSSQVTGFTRRAQQTGEPLGESALDLPLRTLRTRAVWCTISPGQRAGLLDCDVDLPGAAHAAEHAAIGMLPLVAACDRWDVGGVVADLHPHTGRLTIFVYDGNDGGAGFAERGFAAALSWLRAAALAIADCECATGCPSCVQSARCGSGNQPLSKRGALSLLNCLLTDAVR
jgi:DEAD/DEAH box helicase domain-containing protein